MKKKYIFAGLIVILVLLAAVTAPKKEEYMDWVKTQVKKEADNAVVSFGIDLLGDSLLKSSTTCSNYVVFTVCETKLAGNNIFSVGTI